MCPLMIPDHSCVYSDAVSLTIAADVFQTPSNACPSFIDGRGVALTENTSWPRGVNFYPAGFVADERWQETNVDQMSKADFLLLRATPSQFPEWTERTREFVLTHFERVWISSTNAKHVELWRRARPN